MRFVGLLIFSVAALGIASKAQAQADPNVQERANALTSTFNFKSTTAEQSTTVCSPPKLPPLDHDKKAELLYQAHRDNIIKLPDDIIKPPDVVVSAHRSVKAALLANKPRLDDLIIVNERLLVKYYPPNFCDPKQKTTVKLSALSNPDYETNVLKSKTNIQHDTSHAFGGNIEVTTGGFRDFDIMGVSIGSASARYDKFATKSLDVLNTQGIYQFFLGATADGGAKVIDRNTPYNEVPAPGLITVNTFALGFVNLSNYVPNFKTRTSNLFTPQATLTRQNTALFGDGKICKGSSRQPDIIKTYAFCNYIDLAFTVGRTFADVKTLENVNAALEVNVGHRFDGTDFKFAVKTTLTEKLFENVPGGRQDLQLQVVPTLSYTPPALKTMVGLLAPTFSLPVTYTVNHSTLATAEWRGVVVMPTFTLAFAPQ